MSDNPKHQRFGRVFHAPPESEEDRKAALTQELVRDLHQQLMAAIAERDAARKEAAEWMAAWARLADVDRERKLTAERDAARDDAAALRCELDTMRRELDEALAARDAARNDAEMWQRRFESALDTYAPKFTIDAARSPADGLNAVPAGDGGDGILQPSTASLSAAVSVPKVGER